MRKNGKTEYTESQLRVKDFLSQLYDVEMEVSINGLHEVDEIKPTIPPPRADIYIKNWCGTQSLIIRVMGYIHEMKTHKMKDEDQRIVLEGNGYLVLDIWWDDFDYLFTCTDEEAYEELVSYFNGDKICMRE